MNKLVIGLVGYSGSGKGVFSNIATERYGIPVVSTGNFVREETIRRGLELTSENITNVSNLIRNETGGIFMRAVNKKIEEILKTHDSVIVDCLREMNDYKELSSAKGRELVVINVLAPEPLRYLRIVERKRELKFNEDEFKKLTEFELKLGVDAIAKASDYSLINDKDVKSFEQNSLALLLRLEKEKGLVKKA